VDQKIAPETLKKKFPVVGIALLVAMILIAVALYAFL
jgi:hypothetical protein